MSDKPLQCIEGLICLYLYWWMISSMPNVGKLNWCLNYCKQCCYDLHLIASKNWGCRLQVWLHSLHLGLQFQEATLTPCKSRWILHGIWRLLKLIVIYCDYNHWGHHEAWNGEHRREWVYTQAPHLQILWHTKDEAVGMVLYTPDL